jgi:S1-C subfamily serine protease
LLVTLQGRATHRVADLFAALDDVRAGSVATARVLRGGEPRDLQITVGARAA